MPKFEFNQPQLTKAAVVFPDINGQVISLSPQQRLEESCRLAEAVYLDVAYHNVFKIKTPKAATLVGQGIIEELKSVILQENIALVIFDTSLSPIQQRNLENLLNVKVIDRTALILEIFGERAQTKEGKLQVELAHLTYQRSRLVRSWTHLERQRGGGGFLGGPGETQIELDRRIIDNKILRIKKDLEKVKQTRLIQRQARSRVPYPIVAFVGYTNAGKSTLFNLLTSGSVLAKDMLFATLDPTMGKVKLPSGREIILFDTVGFISDLPHELIMAFRATLEEVVSADLLVHIRDISFENTTAQRKDVLDVLTNIGLDNITSSDKYIEVLNKTDLLDQTHKDKLKEKLKKGQVCLSAITGEGREELYTIIDERLSKTHQIIDYKLPVSDGKTYAWIHANSDVLEETRRGETLFLTIKASSEIINRLQHK